jgi:hypothetical protein
MNSNGILEMEDRGRNTKRWKRKWYTIIINSIGKKAVDHHNQRKSPSISHSSYFFVRSTNQEVGKQQRSSPKKTHPAGSRRWTTTISKEHTVAVGWTGHAKIPPSFCHDVENRTL